MSYSDQEIEFWGRIFSMLESELRILSTHHVNFALFMQDPARNERWIRIYFANPVLLAHRRAGASVTLRAFLENGAELVLLGAQVMDCMQREEMGIVADNALLPRQRAAAQVFETMAEEDLQEQIDQAYERSHAVEHRGNCFFEPITRMFCKKWNRSKSPHARKLIKTLPGWLHG
ncbi:hypothetical protein [Methylomicrobium sp. Wu6]|uniref:hypothetical protein n=1 Tax=Methylomicrobium sp. Wu6 TaxID=3107928 RepID=UPI002DD6AFE1|nr:hypothetical protein [Methylomicrobium sp. Wu6]MEC4750024.1 hypothetical protein [Methylomicrobium sp. Wu6]